MATPIYDPTTDGIVYVVQPDHEFDCHQEQYDSDLETVSSASTIRTASTITSDQISDYFREAHGRTYAYDENLPLIYPIDDIEIQRHQMQHRFLRALVHGNYIGPVRDVLRPRADGSRPKILDIRTCSGDWAQDMATEFPHCDIVSIDVAPMTHHVPRSNISFEVYDLYAGIAEPDESFDYVSCRHVQLHVKEYDRLIFDLHRVLKPGGLITICEVENQIFESDQPPYKTPGYQISAPVAAQAIKSLRAATSRQGVNIDDIHHIHKWLQPKSPFWAETCTKYGLPASRQEAASKGYTNIHREVVLLPVGPWHPDLAVQQAGILVSRTFSLAWKQLGPTLIENGASPEEANELCEAVIRAYQSPELRALGKYHMVYATRI